MNLPKIIKWGRHFLVGFLLLAALASGQVQAQEKYRVYFGTYTGKVSKGIYKCDMNLKDAAQIVHFRELHFLPRVIFSIGAICFIGAFFLKLFILGLFGVGIIFIGSTLNLGIGVWMSADISLKRKIIKGFIKDLEGLYLITKLIKISGSKLGFLSFLFL